MNGYIRPIRWKNKVWNTIWNVLYFLWNGGCRYVDGGDFVE